MKPEQLLAVAQQTNYLERWFQENGHEHFKDDAERVRALAFYRDPVTAARIVRQDFPDLADALDL
jgi:hypothetical protein